MSMDATVANFLLRLFRLHEAGQDCEADLQKPGEHACLVFMMFMVLALLWALIHELGTFFLNV